MRLAARDAFSFWCASTWKVVRKPRSTCPFGVSMILVSREYQASARVEASKETSRVTKEQTRPTTVCIDGRTYPTDTHTNVTETMLAKTARRLHLQRDHPISTLRELIESYFCEFTHLRPAHPVVSVAENFDELGFPKDHPGRKPSDTYYVNQNALLRTHTSAHQLATFRAGIKSFLLTADVYRRDEIDASHYPVFHQTEGARIWPVASVVKDIEREFSAASASIGNGDMHASDEVILTESNPMQPCHPENAMLAVASHLKRSLNGMIQHLFRNRDEELEVRWIDAYFPFTSPSWEMEILYQGKWFEICGCGIIQQHILNNSSHEDKIGWAFGLGLERIAMILFEIPDIRLFWSEDSRFITQFRQGEITRFQPFSRYPSCFKDISFWIECKDAFHNNDLYEVVRNIAGDLVEDVKLLDNFTNPETHKQSLCYRINYRSMDRVFTNEEINVIQEKVRHQIANDLPVSLR